MQPYFLFGMHYTIFESLESIILPQMQKGTFNLTGSQYNNCHKILKNASAYLYRFQYSLCNKTVRPYHKEKYDLDIYDLR